MATILASNGFGHEPLDLDRLAKDLALRESQQPRTSTTIETSHELPLFIPLSHTNPLLSVSGNPTFDVDAFLLSRSNTSLSDLRTELRDYLAVLKEELVQLINDDYADFISLRTDLRGEGARLEALEEPLEKIRDEIEISREGLAQIQQAVQDKLSERSQLREEKTLIHLLLKISDLVARLENMLLIPPPPNDNTRTAQTSSSDLSSQFNPRPALPHALSNDDEGVDRSSLNRAKHLSRIAVEYNQLLYHTEKARNQSCVFVDELQRRIDKIQLALSRDLDAIFSSVLRSFANPSSSQQGRIALGSAADASSVRTWSLGELAECLKIYEMLERWDAAEDVFRQEVVAPFVKKTIYQGVLLSSQPSVPSFSVSRPLDQPPISPTTPFTPYPNPLTSAAARFSLSISTSPVPPLPLIETHLDDPLTALLNSVVKFIDNECRVVIELSEKVNKKHRDHATIKTVRQPVVVPAGGADIDDDEEAVRLSERFEFVGRVLWPEIGRALMDELGTMLFAAGRPDEFQKNYSLTHSFLSSLEHASPHADSVLVLRSHRVYDTFERRWQLPVYFQLRWKEIVGVVEDILNEKGRLDLGSNKKGDGFFTPQTRTVYQAIEACWSPFVYIPELAHRFWRLTLQMISRYKLWLDTAVPARRNSTAEKEQQDTTDVDDVHMRAFAVAIADIRNLQRKIRALFDDKIISLLLTEAVLPLEGELAAEHLLQETLAQLDPIIPSLGTQIVTILTNRCCDPLQHVRSIPAQYRAMSARKLDLPTEPSFFIPSVLKPLRDFFLGADSPGKALQGEFGETWAKEVFKAVVIKYTSYLSGMKKTVDSLRRYNKSKRSTFALFTSTASTREGSADKEDRDEIRIRAQMMLDVETLAKDAKSLGTMIDVNKSEEYAELSVLASDPGSAT